MLILVVILMAVCAVMYLQPKGRVSCASFGSYSDALASYNNGDTWLDRSYHGKKDGIPCKELFDKENKK